jgi:hypothetical protein
VSSVEVKTPVGFLNEIFLVFGAGHIELAASRSAALIWERA